MRKFAIARLKPGKVTTISREIDIMASSETCFAMISRQLQRPTEWDLLVQQVRPVSSTGCRAGSISRALVNFGEQTFYSSAVIIRYQPDTAMAWVLLGYPGICVDWSLEPKDNATLVRLCISWKAHWGGFSRFMHRTRFKKKAEADLNKMLTGLKKVVEGLTE